MTDTTVTIRCRWTGATIYEGAHDTVRAAVEAAIRAGADLLGADLYGADLYGAHLGGATLRAADLSRADLSAADLSRADLRYADLFSADLSAANLSYADLTRANLRAARLREADLSGADLRGANLRDADLRDADLCTAELRGANLRRADLRGARLPPAPAVAGIDAAILAASRDGADLKMRRRHRGTAHSRAGWAVVLAGEAGKKLEAELGTNAAAALIYAASTPGGCVVPDWSAPDDDALADLRTRAGRIAA